MYIFINKEDVLKLEILDTFPSIRRRLRSTRIGKRDYQPCIYVNVDSLSFLPHEY